MATFVFVILILFAVLCAVSRAFWRLRLAHRIRLGLLEQAQEHPEQLELLEKAGAVATNIVARSGFLRHADYLPTGALLALIGIASGACGLHLHTGRLAVGLYVGGYMCIIAGLLLAVAGLFVRWVSGKFESHRPLKP
mgnify:CR=1 FL=1